MQLYKEMKENEIIRTNDINSALWLFPRGLMIDGEFGYGMRGQDHRIVECLVPIMDRYSEGFWDYVHLEMKGIRLCPESNIALIKEGQKLTKTQNEILSQTNYDIEIY